MHLKSRNEMLITYKHKLRTCRTKIRASSFNACWARRFGKGSLSTIPFGSLAPFSEREWPLRARLHGLSCVPSTFIEEKKVTLFCFPFDVFSLSIPQRCIRIFHYSKQCKRSFSARCLCSSVVFFFTSSTLPNLVPLKTDLAFRKINNRMTLNQVSVEDDQELEFFFPAKKFLTDSAVCAGALSR